MSREIVTAWTDAYNTGDLDAAMSFYPLDVGVFPDTSVFPEAGPLHGREAARRWTEEIGTAWVNARWVTREVIALKDGRVLTRGD
jgi:ketosteroid isomerase-like protein